MLPRYHSGGRSDHIISTLTNAVNEMAEREGTVRDKIECADNIRSSYYCTQTELLAHYARSKKSTGEKVDVISKVIRSLPKNVVEQTQEQLNLALTNV